MNSLLTSIVILMIFKIALIADENIDCDNAMTTYDMNYCAKVELDEENMEMNTAYQDLMQSLDEEGKRLLQAYQSAWLEYRDKKATFAADAVRGGSAAGLFHIHSLINSTKKRTKELRKDKFDRSEEGMI